MEAGRLTEIISFLKPSRISTEFGSSKTTWEKVITTKANVIYNGGNRQVENYEIFHTYTRTFEIRIYHKIDEGMRILYNGKKYKILAIEERKSQQKKVITTELVNE